ncbi:MAG: hypothetical protein JO304_04915 [Solirubrobacterales bacterium]|nr:hypothetical protein [Solirubrobacterales bacterium]MBV9310395.1 hypothetical protein [Solirubrobacterales bacterium]
MYSLLYAQMIRTQPEEIAARAVRHAHAHDLRAAASGSGRIRSRAGKAIVAFAVCVATVTGVAISDASARQSAAPQRLRVSVRQLQYEINALSSVGFVATSCEVGGTRMTNYSTDQSLLLPW